ncbi:hypothetical protein IL306_007166 [Fusarium sp. DS 682]|nr:hypothetical protein IL306_007166 [Fusarium sp. DS 682]
MQAVNLIYFAQLVSLVGSGFLANDMGRAVGDTNSTVWYTSCITILTAVLNPPIGQAADYWGRKTILVFLPLTGVAGSIIISRAYSSGTIIAGFAILGANYGCQSLSLAVMSEILPRDNRPMAQAVGNISSGIGAILAIFMGGGLLQDGNIDNYRIFWYITAGIYAIASLGCFIGYSPPPRELQVTLTTSQKLKRLDWGGYALLGPALILFCIALSWSQNPYSWDSVNILAPFLIGAVLLIVFIIYELRFKRDGMLNIDLWQHRNFGIAMFIIFVEGIAFIAANSYFAFQVSLVYDASLLSAGGNFALMFVATSIFSPLFGSWSSKRKVLRIPLIIGALLLLVFFILLATSTIDTPRYAFWVYTIVGGTGLGSLLPLSMAASQFATPPELIALTSSMMICVRSLGGSIGLAINNAVIHSALDKELPKVAAAALPLGLPASSLGDLIQALASQNKQAIATVPGITPQIAEAVVRGMKKAYVVAFRNSWIVSAAFSALLVITCLFIKEQADEFDKRIDAPVESGSEGFHDEEKNREAAVEVSHEENSKR